MTNSYPIVEVQPEWVRDLEDMGSKKKFWYRVPDGLLGEYWLFKYPRAKSGEHWAEKVAAEVADLLDIECAKVELAVFAEDQGSVTKAFTGLGQELVHGNQMLAAVVHGYDPKATYRHSTHTLANIWRVMEYFFREAALETKLRMAEYLILDALIGNTDRHHENWGILRRHVDGRWKGFVAPSFDHASSLGRELSDEKRDRRLAENRVGDYAEKGRGAIYWSENSEHGPSPLELVRQAVSTYPDIFLPVKKKLEKLNVEAIEKIVNRIPDDWMSSSAREFAIALMCYNFQQLQELFQ